MDELVVVCRRSFVVPSNCDISFLFEQLMKTWREKCYTVNRRLAGTVEVKEDEKDFSLVGGQHGEFVRRLVVKSDLFSQKCYEISSDCLDDCTATFRSVILDGGKHPHIPFPYSIRLCLRESESAAIEVLSVPAAAASWLVVNAVPALLRWATNMAKHSDSPNRNNALSVTTNSLIDIAEYTNTYRRIKNAIGRPIVLNWTERTDPHKFVYEDCGIASYLIELWKRDGRQPQAFVDVGCGNGLLVHILNKEGFRGEGIDIRKRGCWTSLFKGTSLRELSLDPSSTDISSPEVLGLADFVIGNHSDELSSWVPVLAARLSSPFFLLPCCPFNFHGKLEKRGPGSLYDSFLLFLKDVALSLGFDVRIDRLSIPSTKRICLIGTIPPGGLRVDLEDEIARLTTKPHLPTVFVARPALEKVRNCSAIPEAARETLTAKLFNSLFALHSAHADGEWRRGGQMELQAMADLLSIEEKQLMKEQCGGLQTFLKNQHQVFKVRGGVVRIKDWREEQAGPAARKKTSPCWFHLHHPDGCPLSDIFCSFLH